MVYAQSELAEVGPPSLQFSLLRSRTLLKFAIISSAQHADPVFQIALHYKPPLTGHQRGNNVTDPAKRSMLACFLGS